jgi:hypothetical protein
MKKIYTSDKIVNVETIKILDRFNQKMIVDLEQYKNGNQKVRIYKKYQGNLYFLGDLIDRSNIINECSKLDRFKTKVVFYEEPNEYTEEVDILAVFPEVKDKRTQRIGCYRHVGQHSEADPDYIAGLKKADVNSPEVVSLIAELVKLFDYNLDAER